MKSMVQFLLIPILLLLSIQAHGQIRWNEPKVLNVKLPRSDRKVIHFSGKTTPNAIVRIRKNKVKLYLDNGQSRWAPIPQKDKVQFPITAAGDGHFEFNLYLPTVAVELPMQVKSGRRWKTQSLNYRVPGGSKANSFQAMEDSFRATDEEIKKIDRNDNYYSRKNDSGLILQDREGKQGYDDSKIEAWGGLGFSYFDLSEDSSSSGGSVSSKGSSLVIPTFRFGVDWEFSKAILFKGAVRSTSGSTDDITGGSATVTGKDFNWLEAQAGAVWFAKFLNSKKGRLGLDLGLQLQKLPFFRERSGFINYAYFDNSLYNLHVGAYFQKKNPKGWGYEVYGRYLYPFSAGSAFDLNSSFPLMFEFGGGIRRRLTKGLSFGVFSQLHYMSTKVKYSNNGNNFDVDTNWMLLTVDARLIANF